MLQCALSWLAGGSYHHVRVITGVSISNFYRIIYRVMFAINDTEKLAPRFPRSHDEMKDAAAGFRSISNCGVIEDCIGVIGCVQFASLGKVSVVESYHSFPVTIKNTDLTSKRALTTFHDLQPSR
ncbi:hypothetical protein PF002_g33315 [Phytophthora fragariae]|uniref:DDE Tnp4 domain-containing protein n=1 Tax=Phytophthora fragariae TaxID=53985 RepID=A0A6A3V106_9STRA|nr:hypothetical protein PF011_g32821 [Phytophthora fragariae]KAE9157691.1 hypothetical protein PF002_g33315 [Phytophthora fragariae]